MADVNQIITLGIGTPADIKHFTLVGLSPLASVPPSGPGGLTSIYPQEHKTIKGQPLETKKAQKLKDIDA